MLIALPTYSHGPARRGGFQNPNGVFSRNFPSALFASESEVVGQVHHVVALGTGDMLINNYSGNAPDFCWPWWPLQPGSDLGSRPCIHDRCRISCVFFLIPNLPALALPNCDIQHKNSARGSKRLIKIIWDNHIVMWNDAVYTAAEPAPAAVAAKEAGECQGVRPL